MKPVNKMVLALSFILAAGLTLTPLPTRADAAPPAPPPGYNLQPGEELTNVQMVAEQVIIEVGGPGKIDIENVDPIYEPFSIQGYTAKVHAFFWMQNQGQEAEQLAVRFPIKTNDGWGEFVPVQNFHVEANGNVLEWREDSEPDSEFGMYWAHFDIAFPVGEEVLIEVSYSTVSYTDKFQDIEQLSYILETGAGWYGPIGHGEIILRLPYAATRTNFLLDDSSPGASLIGREVRWVFDDLEPGWKDNWYAAIISPGNWQTILDAQGDLARDPDDLDALLAMGQAVYDTTVYGKVGFLINHSQFLWDLFLLGEDAIARAVSLAPEDTGIRLSYARYLLAHADTWRYESHNLAIENIRPPSADLVQQQLDALAGVELDEDTQWLIESLERLIPDLSAPTKTPAPSPTLPPPTAPPSSTPLPPTPTPIPPTGQETGADTPTSSGQGLPLWANLLLLTFAFITGAFLGRRRSP